ncbi:MAG: preprotein translocase subunit YajC [Candidatus Omnitrophica bacterium]|nr:preprotein translocase subunit YajC [Candidatus Omnitrophota bacterium]
MLNAYAQVSGAAPQGQTSILGSPLIMMVAIFAIFYFLLIRPQKKAQDDHKKMVSQLNKNDEVVTTGGIHGTITNVKDNSVVLKIDDNVKIEVQKNAIGTLKKSRQG